MKLWKISRTDKVNYDEYDSFVAASPNGEDALSMHPADGKHWYDLTREENYAWVNSTASLKIEYLGEAIDSINAGVILASFNAG